MQPKINWEAIAAQHGMSPHELTDEVFTSAAAFAALLIAEQGQPCNAMTINWDDIALTVQQKVDLSTLHVPTPDSRWKHQNGTVYRVKEITNKDSTNPAYLPQIVYVNEANGSVWSRPITDWSRSFTEVPESE